MTNREQAGYGATKTPPTPAVQDFGATVWRQACYYVERRAQGVVTQAHVDAGVARWASAPIAEPAWTTDQRKIQDQREVYATTVWNAACDYMDANTPAPTTSIVSAKKANPYDSTPEV